MPTDDVVAELDRYLVRDETVGFTEMVQRARDEIVALRAQLEAVAPLRIAIAAALAAARREARAEALEEAAQRCDRLGTDYTIPVSADNWSAGCEGCAGRIRALKGKG